MAHALIQCTKCSLEKKKKDFGPGRGKKELSSWCLECKREYQKAYAAARRNDPAFKEKNQTASRRSRLAWYGFSEKDYDDLLKLQGGVCAGCGRLPNPGRNLDIDHEHQPGDKKRQPWERFAKVRGLLCHLCNRTLGIVRDNPDTLRKLFLYLMNPPAIKAVLLPQFEAISAYLEAYEQRKPQ
jgi:hypothetical protein